MSTARYRKKPVVIEALLWSGDTPEMRIAVRAWVDAPIDERGPTGLRIKTLESDGDDWLTVSPGDYIIRGVKGEFYPCKPDIFEATYELVVDE